MRILIISDLHGKKDDLKKTFVEFNKCHCRFRDCNHLDNSLGCAVKEEVGHNIKQSRYENYLKMYESLDR